MKLGILHLSDIHIRTQVDPILGRSVQISEAVYEDARNCDLNLILVSGDVAFSGVQAQYSLATTFLKEIQTHLQRETGREVGAVIVPGNHDCDFNINSSIRSIVIDSIVSDPSRAEDRDVQRLCTEVQQEFFKFRAGVGAQASSDDHMLWTDYDFRLGAKTIRVSAINASWMSRLSERQGELVFPVNYFSETLEKTFDFRIALIHHPLNWYCQSTYHPLRKEIKSRFDMVLSGHEHCGVSGAVVDSLDGAYLYLEAPALQPESQDEYSAFLFLQVDFEKASVQESRYLSNGVAFQREVVLDHGFPQHGVSRRGCDLSPQIVEEFNDAGGKFVHPVKEDLRLTDIFVYPELDCRHAEGKKTICADQLKLVDLDIRKILVLGDDKTGKTVLLRRLFLDVRARGLFPLYLKANHINSVSESGMEKHIKSVAGHQYTDCGGFLRASKQNKIIFVDDFDRLPGKVKNKLHLLRYLEKHFQSVILAASSNMEIAEIVEKDFSEVLSSYDSYEIKNFGHQMRHKLIKKWCMCDEPETATELDQKIHKIEELVNLIIGKNLIPTRPIYLLIILQSCESHQQGDLENSSFAAYYQYLIAKSLQEAGVKKDQLNELYNYLSNLAWFYRGNGKKEIHARELRAFNKEFSERFTTVDFESRLKVLCDAKILSKSDDYYNFLYPYVYYFFVGKFIATKVQDDEIKTLVAELCRRLDRRENANIVLFLSHHVNDSWLADQIALTLSGCFEEVTEIELNGDIGALNKLVDSSVDLIISDLDVDRSQADKRKINDEMDALEVDLDEIGDEAAELIDYITKINLLIKTAEILGQVVKNYYGSIERPKKREYLSEVFGAPLRLVRSVFEVLLNDPDIFVNELEKILKADIGMLAGDEIKSAARKMAFNILGVFCTSLVVRVAQFVSSEKLQEDLVDLVEANPTNARRLIRAAIELTKPGKLPFEDLRDMANDFKNNTFAFNIFQSLVAYHLHMFHTRDAEKQKLCSMARITMEGARNLEIKGGGAKMLPSSKP